MERRQRIDHGRHGDEGEQAGGNAADLVAEVEQADGEPAEDDGEVEPGEEGAFVGEKNFGLHPRGQGDAFSCFGGKRGKEGLVGWGLNGGGKGKWGEGGEWGKRRWKGLPGGAWRRAWDDMVLLLGESLAFAVRRESVNDYDHFQWIADEVLYFLLGVLIC